MIFIYLFLLINLVYADNCNVFTDCNTCINNGTIAQVGSICGWCSVGGPDKSGLCLIASTIDNSNCPGSGVSFVGTCKINAANAGLIFLYVLIALGIPGFFLGMYCYWTHLKAKAKSQKRWNQNAFERNVLKMGDKWQNFAGKLKGQKTQEERLLDAQAVLASSEYGMRSPNRK